MPTYAYTCQECSHEMEELQKITEAPLVQCPKCGNSTLKRGPGGGIGLSFKGAGFYINDYAKKDTAATSTAKAPKTECCPCGSASKCKSTN